VLRRLLAATLGVVVAVTAYQGLGVLIAAHPHFTHLTPMSVALPKPPAVRPSIHIVNPTPVRLVIPSINVDATIEARGLDAGRNMETPTDFHDVAWYKLGPRPGEPGDALINGHVNWWTGTAVFTKLADLRRGDAMSVIRADGVEVKFHVTGSQTVAANARVASLFAPGTVATLTLITCTGDWNPLTLSDTRRLLVSAALD
jgi:LPXTG-site transpeptidase (sortase) family protein